MGFEQYHEPANELSEDVRTFVRMIVALTEEAEAINWYEQRISVEKDGAAKSSPAEDRRSRRRRRGQPSGPLPRIPSRAIWRGPRPRFLSRR